MGQITATRNLLATKVVRLAGQKLGSTATSTVITRLLPLTNYISGAENETQRALLGHTNGNIEKHSLSAAAILTMVAAATIVRFPPSEHFPRHRLQRKPLVSDPGMHRGTLRTCP